MKGDEHFRVSSRCYIQFANEILIYSKVIPYYEKVLSEAAAQSTKAECWIPKVYAAQYGKIDGFKCAAIFLTSFNIIGICICRA